MLVKNSLNRMLSVACICLAANGLSLNANAQEAAVGKAQIIFETRSTSSATRGKNYEITYYADEQCSKRGKSEKVAKKKFADDIHVFNPYLVETDVNFIFQVAYMEKRRGEVRRCSAIANAPLIAGRTYKAVYQVIEEVIGCGVKVFDTTDQVTAADVEAAALAQTIGEGSAEGQIEPPQNDLQVVEPVELEVTTPEFTCTKVGKPGFKSGTPVYSYKDRLG